MWLCHFPAQSFKQLPILTKLCMVRHLAHLFSLVTQRSVLLSLFQPRWPLLYFSVYRLSPYRGFAHTLFFGWKICPTFILPTPALVSTSEKHLLILCWSWTASSLRDTVILCLFWWIFVSPRSQLASWDQDLDFLCCIVFFFFNFFGTYLLNGWKA